MRTVAKALWFIEGQFGRCPSLDDIAVACGTSRFHLSRSFRLATGLPVMAYARGRRLTEAYKSLSIGAPSILPVALEAGYSSHEAFTRAFHDQFGLRPEEVRNGRSVDSKLLVEPIKMENARNITLEEPRVERKGALTIAGLGARFRLDESQNIPALWQKFQEYEGSLNAVPGLWYGVCGDWGEEKEDFFYMAGVGVTHTEGLPPELGIYRFPSQTYLVFRHDRHISELHQTMGAIFGRYLPEQGHDIMRTATYFELYDDKFDPITGLGGLELWMPAATKAGGLGHRLINRIQILAAASVTSAR
jgi:AraC family transcriptional regulator